MPRASLRPCLARLPDGRGCPELVRGGSYCAAHRPRSQSPSTIATRTPFHKRRRAALVRQGPPWRCSLCGGLILTATDMDAHHVVPVAEGGTDGPVAAAHVRCNRSQGSRPA